MIKVFTEDNALELAERLLQNDKDIKDEFEQKEYATETFVTNAIANAQLSGGDVDLSGYASKDDLDNYALKSQIPSLDGYAKTEDIPDEYDDTTLSNRITTVENDYLKSSDKTELTQAIATAKTETIETILGESVDADFDTLQEVADWIQSDTTASAELVIRVTNAESDIATIQNDYLKSVDKTELLSSISTNAIAIEENTEAIADNTTAIAVERARIDAFTVLPEGSTTGDAALEDIKIKADGTTSDTAGNAVREQINTLDDKIDEEVSKLSSEIEELTEVVGGVPTVNMFDKDKASSGQITTSGAVNTDSNYYTSELFTIDKTKKYSISDNGERIAVMTDSAYICKDFGFNLVNSLNWVKHENGLYIFDFPNSGIAQSPIYIKASVYKEKMEEFWIIEGDKIVVNKIAELEKDVASLKENESYNPNRVVCIGDSQTGGTDGNSYPTLLKNNHLSNYEVVNFGNGGELVTEIAWRCGALPLYINPFTLPADTSKVEITKKLANDRTIYKLFTAWNNANPVNVGGVECYITSNGTIYRAESGAEVTFDRPILANPPLPLNKDNCTHVLLFGQNGGFSGIDDYIALAKSIIACMPNDKYIIIPPYTKSFVSQLNNMTYDDFLSVMYNNFGVHVFDLRNYLVNYGLIDNGLTATETDNTAIANGEVPPQLYTDYDVHMNIYGLTSHAKGLYLYGKDLGYWS